VKYNFYFFTELHYKNDKDKYVKKVQRKHIMQMSFSKDN